MTTIDNTNIINLIFDKMKKETSENKYLLTQNTHYIPILIEQWDILTEEEKKEIAQYCLSLSLEIKGADTKNHELRNIIRVSNLPNFNKVKPYIEDLIEHLPSKNGNQVIQRYIQSHVWKTTLKDNHFEKINDKTNIAVRGWLLPEMLSTLPKDSQTRQWLCKRLFVSHSKNSAQENVQAILNVNIETLSETDITRLFSTVNHLFYKQGNEITLDDLVNVNAKIGQYLDTIQDLNQLTVYMGVPDTFLTAVPIDDIYIQRYALNIIFKDYDNQYYFGASKASEINPILIENCRLFKERTKEMEQSFKANTLNSIFNRNSSPIDSFFFDYFPMGFKVLITMVTLFKVLRRGLDHNDIQVIPQLIKVGDYLRVDVTPIISAILKDENPIEHINNVFKGFFSQSTEKMSVLATLMNIELYLGREYFCFNFKKGIFEYNENAKHNTVHDYLPLLTIFETALKDMGADLGYNEEEIELLF